MVDADDEEADDTRYIQGTGEDDEVKNSTSPNNISSLKISHFRALIVQLIILVLDLTPLHSICFVKILVSKGRLKKCRNPAETRISVAK